MSLPCRKTLTFQDLGAHLEKLLAEDNVAEDGKGHTKIKPIFRSIYS